MSTSEQPDEPAHKPAHEDRAETDTDGATGGTTDGATAGATAAAPAQPWPEGYEFGKQDGICASLIGLMTLYSLAMIPLRPVILGLAPIVLVTLTGSMTGLVMCGALGATGWGWWPAAIVIGTLSVIKFDFVWWWAGKLWGDHFIASIAGQTERARRRAKRAENLTRRYDILAIGLGHVPFVPVPRSIVAAVLGAAGTSLKRLFLIDVIFAFIYACSFVALGWQIGEPAVAALEEFGKYMWYVSIVLLVGVFYVAYRNAKKQSAQRS
ncbi:DedA family protein [Piscicoccus intestinalis]|uniref:DedA family protein n=1 Tax=Piscicoccus intestinalis TaxID=746033 RepID=UPI000838B376|nr:hypothetical protein [Piscicoccus intestinalis]